MAATSTLSQPQHRVKAPLKKVVADGRLAMTLLLWLTLACVWQAVNFLGLWGPPLLQKSGYTVAFVALALNLHYLAAIPAQSGAGYIIDRKGPFGLLIICTAGSVAALLSLAVSIHAPLVVKVSLFFSGLLLGPCVTAVSYVAALIYPADIRSTGLGWMFGIGRLGAVLGSLAVGSAVSAGVAVPTIFGTVAGSAATAMVASLLISTLLKRRASIAALS